MCRTAHQHRGQSPPEPIAGPFAAWREVVRVRVPLAEVTARAPAARVRFVDRRLMLGTSVERVAGSHVRRDRLGDFVHDDMPAREAASEEHAPGFGRVGRGLTAGQEASERGGVDLHDARGQAKQHIQKMP